MLKLFRDVLKPGWPVRFGPMPLVLGAVLLCQWCWGVRPLFSQVASDQPTVSALQIPDLIRQLNCEKYEERQYASQALVMLGSRSLRPLAKHYFESSPEIRWRTRAILEEIGVSGDEATFFKAAALLRLICGEQDTASRLQQHFRRWQQMQTERAAEKLRSLGATVQLYEPASGQQQGDFLVFLEPEWVAPGLENQALQPARKPPGQVLPEQRLDEQQISKKIDQILVASIDQNRQFAFESDANWRAAVNDSELQAFRVFGNEHMLVLPDGRLVYSEQYYPGSQLAIDQDWRGDVADLQLANAIEHLADVRFISVQLTAEQLQVFNRIESIRTIKLASCEVDPAAWKVLSEHASLAQVVVESMKLDRTAMTAIAAIPQLSSLRLAHTPFAKDTFEAFDQATQLTVLILENVQLQSAHIEAICRARRVLQIQLTNCRFTLDDYRRLVERPGIEVNIIGSALLGIREARLPSSQSPDSCQVGEVVSGSAAHTAGLQVNDCIVRINDHNIKNFRELVAVVSQFQPGDDIDLTVQRGSQIIELRATLGARQ